MSKRQSSDAPSASGDAPSPDAVGSHALDVFADIEQRIEQLRHWQEQSQEQFEHLRHSAQQLQHEHDALDRRQRELDEQRARLEADSHELRERTDELDRREQELDAERAALTEREQALEPRAAELERQHAELERTREQLATESSRLDEQWGEYRQKQQALDERAAELDKQAQQLTEERERIDADRAELDREQAEVAKAQEAVKELEAELETSRDEHETQRAELDGERERLTQDRAAADQLIEQLTTKKRELDKREFNLKLRGESLEAEEQRLEQTRQELADQAATVAEQRDQHNEQVEAPAGGAAQESAADRKHLDEQRQRVADERQRLEAQAQELAAEREALDSLQRELEQREAQVQQQRDKILRRKQQLKEADQAIKRRRARVREYLASLREHVRAYKQRMSDSGASFIMQHAPSDSGVAAAADGDAGAGASMDESEASPAPGHAGQQAGLERERQMLAEVRRFLEHSEAQMMERWASTRAASVAVGVVIAVVLLAGLSYMVAQRAVSPRWEATMRLSIDPVGDQQDLSPADWAAAHRAALLSQPVLSEAMRQIDNRGVAGGLNEASLAALLDADLDVTGEPGTLTLTLQSEDRERIEPVLSSVGRALLGHRLAEDRRSDRPDSARVAEAATRAPEPVENRRLITGVMVFLVLALLTAGAAVLGRYWLLKTSRSVFADAGPELAMLDRS